MAVDAWDIVVASAIQVARCVVAQLQVTIINASCCFFFAVIEGAILANSLSEKRRITLYPALMLLIRLIIDTVLGFNVRNAATGLLGSLIGLWIGPVFHQPPGNIEEVKKVSKDEPLLEIQSISDAATIKPASRQLRRVTSAIHTMVDVDNEVSQPLTFTPLVPSRSMDNHVFTNTPSRTRVDTEDEAEEIHKSRLVEESIYQDAQSSPAGVARSRSVKETVRHLRANAKNEDLTRRTLLLEREKMINEGDTAWAFLLKHRADIAKRKMEEADKEAAKVIFNYYNPPDRHDIDRVDLHGLQVSEAIKFCDEALSDAQISGRNQLTVVTGRGKHPDGGKAKIKPALRQYAKTLNISIKDTEDSNVVHLRLPPLLSRPEYDHYVQ